MTNSMPSALAKIGNYVYLSDDYGRDLLVIDVSNITLPTIVKKVPTQRGYEIHQRGNYTYNGTATGGLMVLDIANPASPSVLLRTGSVQPRDVVVSGNYAYFAAGTAGVQIADISNPATARVVRTVNFPDPSEIWSLHIAGTKLYAGEFSAGKIHVVDISVPTAAYLERSFDSQAFNTDMAGTDSRLYATGGDSGWMKCFDISNPASTVPLYTVRYSSDPFQLASEGNYVYMAGSFAGLEIADVSSPTAGTMVKTLATSRAYGIAAKPGYAFLSDSSGSLSIYDTSNPSTITASVASLSGQRYGKLSIANDYLFIGSENYGYSVIDVSNATAPFRAADYGPGKLRKLVPSGAYLIGLDADKGLVILGD
jgi:hypothetical protein